MKTDNRLLVQNSTILYARLVITGVLGLLITKIVLSNLGVENYGVFSVIGGLVLIMSFINTVMISVSNRYVAYELGKGSIVNINRIFNICLNTHIFVAILLICFGIPIGEWYIRNYINIQSAYISDAIWVLRFSAIGSAVSFIGVPLNGLIVANEKFLFYSITEIVGSVFRLITAFTIPFWGENKLIGYALLMSFATALPTLMYYVYCKIQYRDIIRYKFISNIKEYKEIMSFSVWVGYGAFAYVGKEQGANLILNYFFGATLNAALGIANSINKIVLMFAQGINRAIAPQITKSFASDNLNRTEDLVIASSKYTFLLMCLPALPIFIEADFLLRIWLTEVPDKTATFIRLIIIDVLIGALSAGITEAIFATGKIKSYQITVNSILVLSIPISYIFIRSGNSPEVLFYSYIFLSITALIARQYFLYKSNKFNIQRIIIESYLPILYVIISLIPLFLFQNLFSSIGMIVFSVVYLIMSIFIVGLSKNEKKVVLEKTIMKFISHTKN